MARRRKRPHGRIDFNRVRHAALARLPELLARWLPGGEVRGREYTARNPRRVDHRLGSMRVNLTTGRWADFAVEDARGGDPISLAAYLAGCSQTEAARRLGKALGLN